MRIIIVGFGETARELVSSLEETASHELTLIDVDESRCEVAASYDALALQGDGTDPEVLKQARCAEADAVVAMTGKDALNTVVAMLAKNFGVQTVVVQLNGRGLRAACESLGVSSIVAPRLTAAAEIRNSLLGLANTDLSVLQKGDIRLLDVTVGKWTASKLKELELPDGVLVLGVQRSDQVLFPSDSLSLREDDSLLLLTRDGDALVAARDHFAVENEDE